jgi:hypothetical protein
MINKYLSSSVILASLILLFTACDNTGSTLTEIWRAKAPANEYISENYVFDGNSSMIAQGLKFGPDGNEIYSLFKIDSSGQTQWSVPSYWGVVKIDGNNNIFVFNKNYPAADKFCITKYSPAGAILWQNNDIEAVCTLEVENVSAAGVAYAIDATGNIFMPGKSGNGYAIAKLDPNGKLAWRKAVSYRPFSMATDKSGNLYAGCDISITPNEAYNLRVLKYDGATSSLLWDKVCLTDVTYGELNTSYPLSMTMDNANNLVISRNDRAAKIDKFSASGDHLWNYSFKPTDTGTSINVDSAFVRFDSSNNTIISAVVSVQTGSIWDGTSNFPFPLGYQYCQLIKLDSTGKKAWSKKVSNVMIMNGDTGGELCVDKNDNIYVFCLDKSLMKYNAGGKKLWTYTPEITDVSMGQISEWHVDSNGYLYWILQCGAVEMTDGYWITKYSQE